MHGRRHSPTTALALRGDPEFHHLLDALPAAAYTCDTDGLITYFNRHAVELWGREPRLNDPADRFCGSFRLFAADGSPIAHDRCWMALALQDGRDYNAQEIVVERSDGTRRTVLAHANPFHDELGFIRGAVNVLVDITDQKRAEEALRASRAELEAELADTRLLQGISSELVREEGVERLYEKLIDAAVAITRSDFASMQGFYPERGRGGELRLLASRGFGPQAAEFWEWVRADSGCTCGEALRTGKRVVTPDVEDCEFIAGTPDRETYLRAGIRAVQSTPLVSRAGRLVGMISTHWRRPHEPTERDLRLMDILARQAADLIESKQAEERLRRNRQTFVELVERAPFGIYVVDSRLRIAHMNAGSQAGAFQNVRPVIGRDLAEVMRTLWPEPVAARVVAAFRRTLETGESYRSKDFVEPRGDTGAVESYEWELHRVALPDGRYGVICYYYDSTQVRDAERSLREKARLLDLSNDAIVIREFGGRIVYWNRGAERTYGWAGEEALGRNIHELLRTQFSVPLERIHEALIAGGAWTGELVQTTRDGRTITVLCRKVLDRDAHGNPAAVLETMTDISDRKRAEESLREADRRKTEFLATLAHELRNPLAPLRNALQIARLAGQDREAVERAHAVMGRQLNHLVRLVDDLLDVSRISKGKIELRTERFDLASAVRDAVEVSRPQIEAAGHALTVELPPAPLWVEGDRTRLAQVFSNLLNNSARYTERGGRILIRAASDGGGAVVSVADSGVGIPAEVLPRIFEMFTQADRHLERTRGGLGIGLSLVKGLVELHRGTVKARSEGPGRGSEFVVRLPVAAAPRAEPRAAAGEARGGPRFRVLVVDDNEDAADSLGVMLELMGHTTRTAYDGAAAVEAAAEFRPDVILLDIGLPRVNGYEVCRRIRQEPWGQRVIVIAQTGWGQDEDRCRSAEAGFNFHLVKPVAPAALEKLLAGLAPVC